MMRVHGLDSGLVGYEGSVKQLNLTDLIHSISNETLAAVERFEEKIDAGYFSENKEIGDELDCNTKFLREELLHSLIILISPLAVPKGTLCSRLKSSLV